MEGPEYTTQDLARAFMSAWEMIGNLHDLLEEFQAQNVELLQYCRELEAKVDAVIEWKGDKIVVAPHITGRPL